MAPQQNHVRFLETFKNLHYGELHIKQDEATGLMAIVAIHSTHLGPALGGCRFRAYHSFDDAVNDALRLAHGMSYKAAIHRLALGGGKAVIIAPPSLISRTKLFMRFAEFVNTLGGRYITAEDSGTSIEDMDIINTVTPHVTGNSAQAFSCNDPSPLTALGVCKGIEAAVKYRLQKESCDGIHVAIQGVGHVGYHLAKELYKRGAKLSICDINPQHLMRCQNEFPAAIVSPEAIHRIQSDVFAPCALGNVINRHTIDEIQAPIVAGAANNQLESLLFAQYLKDKGILYAPDYVINGGGLIHVAAQYYRQDEQNAKTQVENIYYTLLDIFERSTQENLPTAMIADKIAEERLFVTA